MNDPLRQPGLRPCPVEDVLVRNGDGWRFKDGVQYSFCNPDGITFTSGGDPTILYGNYSTNPADRLHIQGIPVGAWTDGERRCIVPFPYGFSVSANARHISMRPAILVLCRDVRDPDSGAIRRDVARPFVLWREDVVR